MFHFTADNPTPRYALIDRMFPKFPCYLRRVTVHAPFGAVSSYLSNYRRRQAGRHALQAHQQTPNVRQGAGGTCAVVDSVGTV